MRIRLQNVVPWPSAGFLPVGSARRPPNDSAFSRRGWELRGFVEDVQCYFLRTGRTHTLAVERAGEELLCEEFDRLADLMTRAAELRRSLVKVGFRPAPLDEDLADQPVLETLLLHFVREGTAMLHGLPLA